MRTRFFLTLSMMLSAGVSLTAQDLKQALSRMQQLYAKSDRLHIVMKIQALESETASTPYYHEQADIKREGANYRYLFGATEMLLNDRFLIVVDKSARELMYQNRNKKDEKVFAPTGAPNLDSLFRFYENPQYLGLKGEVSQYRIIQKKGPVDQIEMDIHAKSGLLKRMQYHYRNGPVVVIQFLVFDTHPQFETGLFDENKYLIAETGKLKTTTAFKNYHVSQAQTP